MPVDDEQLEVAIFSTVHVPEGASIKAWRRRPEEPIVVFAVGDERFELELDEGVIPTFAEALTRLPQGEEQLWWGGPVG